ncbi:MAG: type II secretion system F family protein [Candidatus Saccharimonas sp.]|nr:type II secretion system F family protein [Planctomycetaceae bacterium]
MTSTHDDQPVIRFTDADVESVLGQLDTTARAKLPLAPALNAMADETYSPKTRRGLRQLAARLERGESLHQALNSVELRLSPALRVLAEQGTQFGRFDAVLHWSVEQTRRSNELRRQLWVVLTYPLFLISIVATVGSFLFVVIVPQFAKIFDDFGTQLPGITVAVISVSQFCAANRLPALLALAVVLVLATGPFAWRGHWLVTRRWSGSIPLIGPLFRLAALSEFCHLLAVFVESGMPLAAGALVAGESSEDEWLQLMSVQLALDIDRGIEAEMAAITCGFPSSLAHVLREATSPKVLADALHGLAEIYSARTEVSSHLTSSIVEPFVMVLTVVGLGTIVIALFMPLIKLLNDLS